jgi:hypothetical protein
VGDRVGIRRGLGANRREGAYHSLARRGKRTCKRERLEETALIRAPWGMASGSLDIRGEVVRRTGKDIYREKMDGT